MAVNTSEQIVREAADIEAYKIGLLQSAKALADQGIQLPPQMVAEMSQLQLKAGELAEAGIGQYKPYLDAAAGTLGDAQNVTGQALVPAQAMQADAAGMFKTAESGIADQVGAAQQGIGASIDYGQAATEAAQQGLGQAALNTQQIAGQSMADQLKAYDAIPGQITTAQQGMTDATQGARTYGKSGIGAYQDAITGSQQAVKGARNITADAAAALQQAGAFGQQTAEQGIAGLAGTTGAYDPASAGAFMNQYEDAAVQQALADIQRAGEIQQQGAAAQAVGAGAFGGSRAAVQEAELARNILEQQARTAAGMRQAGFENAAGRSQQAFEAQQGRGQQAAQLTGSLGAQGAGSAISAAQGAGQLGLSAEQLAAAQAGQLGQLGLSSAEVGMSGEQLAGQLANQAGQLGLSGAQTQAGIAAQAGQMGMAGEQFAGQMAGQAGQLGQGQAQMGLQGAQAAGALGLQGQEMTGRVAEGLGTLGSQAGQLGLQQGTALKDIGLSQASLGELGQNMAQKEQGFLFDVGKQFQAQDQANIEADRQTQLQQAYEPYQRVGFLSDIYKGAPSSQSTITATTTPNVSPAQSILGLGVAGLSAAAGARNAGIF
jgi:hypothetical protein